jgi:hypothetical protein
MIGDFIAYYLSQTELKNVLEINKRFEAHYSPYIMISIIHHFNEETFEGIISFAENNGLPQPITKMNDRNYSIMQEYYDKKEGVFTFDGIRFFKIINSSTKRDEKKIIVFIFKYISHPTFSQINTAFMIMPFGDERLNSFYENNIRDYLITSELKIRVFRSDDFTGTDVVADTLLEQIRKAEFVICDITECNKNVFFEIGYAKGINKDILFLLEKNKPANFFDVNHIRRIEYNYDNEDDFRKLLVDTLISIRNTRLA